MQLRACGDRVQGSVNDLLRIPEIGTLLNLIGVHEWVCAQAQSAQVSEKTGCTPATYATLREYPQLSDEKMLSKQAP